MTAKELRDKLNEIIDQDDEYASFDVTVDGGDMNLLTCFDNVYIGSCWNIVIE